MDQCPVCDKFLPDQWRETQPCPSCGEELLVEFFERYSHSYSEFIGTTFDRSSEGCGLLRKVIHRKGTVLCMICGEVFRSELLCCPTLMGLAIDFVEEAWETAAKSKRDRLLMFVERNMACFAQVVNDRRRDSPGYKAPVVLREYQPNPISEQAVIEQRAAHRE